MMTVNLIKMKLSDCDVGGAEGGKKEARRQRLTKGFTHSDIVGADEGQEAEGLQDVSRLEHRLQLKSRS